MNPSPHKIGLAAYLMIVLVSAIWSPSAKSKPAPLTLRLLNQIEADQHLQKAELVSAARELMARGDRAYRAHDYRRALTEYTAAFGNAPTVRAAILLNDVQWRLRIVGPNKRPAPCPTEPSTFRNTLRTDIAQGYDLGIALNDRIKTIAPDSGELVQRATSISSCAHQLLDDPALPPPGSCLDLTRLEACLGPPLLN